MKIFSLVGIIIIIIGLIIGMIGLFELFSTNPNEGGDPRLIWAIGYMVGGIFVSVVGIGLIQFEKIQE
jgi:hypothetical protein